MYTAADGPTMANRGEKEVARRTNEGYDCTPRMRVTDVQRPLISVTRICDVGQRVVLTSQGGYVEHEGTGQVATFYRDHIV